MELALTDEIDSVTREQLKELTGKWDNEKWKLEIANKTSLSVYRQWKELIQEEEIYDNYPSSVTLFKARSDTLQLNIVYYDEG